MERLQTYTETLDGRRRSKGFASYARAVARGDGFLLGSLERELDAPLYREYQRAIVGALTAPGPGSPAGLDLIDLGGAWLAGVQQQTILGRLAGATPVPINVRLPGLITEPTGGWVGEGRAIPACAPVGDTLVFTPTKLAALIGLSQEIVRATSEAALNLFDAQLRRAVAIVEDAAVLSDAAAVAGLNPAGWLAGLSAVGSGADLGADMGALIQAVRGGNPGVPTFVCSPAAAVYLAQQGHRDVAAVGAGRLAGAPQIVSAAAGNRLVLVDGADLALADGGIALDSASSASVELDDAPSGGAMTSAFSGNLTFLKITRFLNWQFWHADAVAYLELPIGGSPA